MVETLFDAVKAGDAAAVREWVTRAPESVNARDQEGNSPLILALYYGQKDIANLFIDHGATLTLYEAAAAGNLERVRRLVQADRGTVNSYSHDGFTPLHLAAFFGNSAILDFLVEAGADVNAVATNGSLLRPIHSAAAHSQNQVAQNMVETLVVHGADVNVKQQGGFTAIHTAADNGNLPLAQYLLAHGADVNVKTDDGKTPLAMALEKGRPDVAALFRQHGAA